jgi:hypothetical protein
MICACAKSKVRVFTWANGRASFSREHGLPEDVTNVRDSPLLLASPLVALPVEDVAHAPRDIHHERARCSGTCAFRDSAARCDIVRRCIPRSCLSIASPRVVARDTRERTSCRGHSTPCLSCDRDSVSFV